MILIAGGTGKLGTCITELLTARGLKVRILTREPLRARHLKSDLVEIVSGDVRDPAVLQRAVAGATTVVSAIQGFSGRGGDSPSTVDWEGNRALIHAAGEAGVGHFILVSVQGASADHPMDLHRMKYRAERELQASRLAWTIIRPTAFMETWIDLIGRPLLQTGKTRIFGRGRNPINFVSIHDVARLVELAVADPALRGALVEIGGPENLSMEQLVDTVERVTGKTGARAHVPLSMMRVMSALMRPVNPTLARQIHAGVVMDTRDMRFDPSETAARYPSIPQTRLAEVVRRELVELEHISPVPAKVT
jgi:uncharacterized protein YbjT (DUF2867 family)